LWNWNELAANQVGASYPNRPSEPVLHHAYVLCRAAFSPVSYQPNGGPTRAPEINNTTAIAKQTPAPAKSNQKSGDAGTVFFCSSAKCFAAAAFASLMAMGSAPASAFGCTTQWVNGRITQVCDSAVAGSMLNVGRPRYLPPVRCRQPLGFNQPYVCN